jgi:hypothetical protein
MNKIILKGELKAIQKNWNQIGGFGGTLKSGIEYSSESYLKRIGVLRLPIKDDIETVRFFENDTVEEILERVSKVI